MADETDRRKEQDADFEGDDQRSGQDRRQGDRRAAAADKHGKGYYATWGFAAGVLPAIALLLMIRFDDPVKRRGTCGAQIIRRDTLDPHEHLHMLASDTAWRADGDSDSMGEGDSEVLTRLFQHQVLEMMVSQRRLTRDFADKLRAWHPSGFSVYRGRPIDGEDRPALERLAAYILRPSFAASRLAYDPEQGQIDYRTPKGVRRTLDALDWIALVTSHIPGPREQTTRYYGRYSNAARGKRRLAASLQTTHGLPTAEDSEENSATEEFSRQRRRNWARLLQKVYEVDALRCPKCGHALEIIAVIEKPNVIEDILKHLDLWQLPQRAPPPRLFPHKLERFLASLSPQQAQAARTCNDALFWDEVPTWED